MNKFSRLSVALLSVLGLSAHVSGQGISPRSFAAIYQETIKWAPFAAFPPGAQLAILVGDPTKTGPYVIRVKVPGNVTLMPHTHPEDRIYTVISGVFYIATGTTFDASKLIAYPPGSVVVLPANTPHFHRAMSGEYITQVTALGPLGLNYINAADDPRNKGK